MREDIFRRLYANKSDDELEYIIDNRDKYVTEASKVAAQLLEERTTEFIKNSSYPKRMASLEALENHLDATSLAKPKDKRTNFVTDNPNDPELYTQTTVTVFTLLFGILFGAALMMYNMSKTNNRKERWSVLLFAILYTVFVIIVFGFLIGGDGGTLLSLFTNLIAAIIIAAVFWNKYIGKEFEHRSKNWVFAAVVSSLISLPLVLLAIINR